MSNLVGRGYNKAPALFANKSGVAFALIIVLVLLPASRRVYT
jgi:hypothetical protein